MLIWSDGAGSGNGQSTASSPSCHDRIPYSRALVRALGVLRLSCKRDETFFHRIWLISWAELQQST